MRIECTVTVSYDMDITITNIKKHDRGYYVFGVAIIPFSNRASRKFKIPYSKDWQLDEYDLDMHNCIGSEIPIVEKIVEFCEKNKLRFLTGLVEEI